MVFRHKRDNGHTEALDRSSDYEEDRFEAARLEAGRPVKGCGSKNKQGTN